MGRDLPHEPGVFVGRDREIAELGALVDAGERLVTVWGAAGVGKTRLAIELARRWQRAGGGGTAVFCDLTEAHDTDGVCAGVAAALGVALTAGDAVASVGAAVAALGRALVVLDNLEQLAASATAWLTAWLRAAPDACWVVTSRERLRLRAEVAFELDPLGLDAGQAGEPSPAERMLLDRIARVRRGYAPDGAERRAVGEVARRLEGVPLALELAAARVAALGPHAVLARLGDPLAALGDGACEERGAHGSLRASLDASWQLLTPRQRTALAQCSVFAGGFRVEDADGVLDRGENDGSDTAEVLAALRDKSLLRATGARDAEEGAPTRLGMLVSVREYAAARLAASGRERDAMDRHARHYAAAAEAWQRQAVVPGAEETPADRIAAERANLFAAAERARRGQVALALGLRALVAMRTVVASRGPIAAYVAALDPLIDAALGAPAGEAVDREVLVLARSARASLGYGRRPAAWIAAELDAVLAQPDAVADPPTRAAVLYNAGRTWLALRRLDRVEPVAAALEALARATGSAEYDGRGALLLGTARREQGASAEACALLERAAASLRAAGNPARAQLAEISLGCAWTDRAEPARARAVLTDSLAWCRATGDAINACFVTYGLGLLEHDQGRHERAVECYAAAADGARAVGDTVLEAEVRGFAALARAERGTDADVAAARAALAGLGAGAGSVPAVGRRDALFRACVGALDWIAGAFPSAEAYFESAAQTLAAVADPWAPVVPALRRLVGAPGGDGAVGPPDVVEVRLVCRALGAIAARAPVAPPPPSVPPPSAPAAARSPATTLVVHAGGDWFQWGDGARVRLRARPVLRAVLAALAAARSARPGEPLSQDALVRAGWPGQRMYADAARNRLHGAIHRLRAAGLHETLAALDDGYLLDPRVPLVLADTRE